MRAEQLIPCQNHELLILCWIHLEVGFGIYTQFASCLHVWWFRFFLHSLFRLVIIINKVIRSWCSRHDKLLFTWCWNSGWIWNCWGEKFLQGEILAISFVGSTQKKKILLAIHSISFSPGVLLVICLNSQSSCRAFNRYIVQIERISALYVIGWFFKKLIHQYNGLLM